MTWTLKDLGGWEEKGTTKETNNCDQCDKLKELARVVRALHKMSLSFGHKKFPGDPILCFVLRPSLRTFHWSAKIVPKPWGHCKEPRFWFHFTEVNIHSLLWQIITLTRMLSHYCIKHCKSHKCDIFVCLTAYPCSPETPNILLHKPIFRCRSRQCTPECLLQTRKWLTSMLIPST